MRQMWMRAAVAAALNKREMLVLVGVVNSFGGETSDRFWEQMSIIGNLDLLGFFPAEMQDRFVAFDELPFKGGVFAVNIETFNILTGGVEKESGSLQSQDPGCGF